jgi:hypothetical protein
MNARCKDEDAVRIAAYVRAFFEIEQKKGKIWCDERLCGACSFAASILWKELQNFGVEAHFVLGQYVFQPEDSSVCEGSSVSRMTGELTSDHCWVRTRLGIIDVTASQFGLPAVYISEDNPNYLEFRQDDAAVKVLREEWCEWKAPSVYRSLTRRFRTWKAKGRGLKEGEKLGP